MLDVGSIHLEALALLDFFEASHLVDSELNEHVLHLSLLVLRVHQHLLDALRVRSLPVDHQVLWSSIKSHLLLEIVKVCNVVVLCTHSVYFKQFFLQFMVVAI